MYLGVYKETSLLLRGKSLSFRQAWLLVQPHVSNNDMGLHVAQVDKLGILV